MKTKVDILRIKAWIILVAFLLFMLLMTPILNFLTSLLKTDMELFGAVVFLVAYFIYPIIVGLRLRTMLSSQPLYSQKSNTSLIVDCCMIVIPFIASRIWSYQEREADILYISLAVVLAVMSVVGFARLGAFPARAIRSIELKRNAGIWEYASETFQMFYWPVGVLWMQPRVNKIASKSIITISE